MNEKKITCDFRDRQIPQLPGFDPHHDPSRGGSTKSTWKPPLRLSAVCTSRAPRAGAGGVQTLLQLRRPSVPGPRDLDGGRHSGGGLRPDGKGNSRQGQKRHRSPAGPTGLERDPSDRERVISGRTFHDFGNKFPEVDGPGAPP